VTVRVILTDLDGTLLEPGGEACEDVRSLLAELSRRLIPVCPVSSKTAAELRVIGRELALRAPAGFENGAGVLDTDDTVELDAAAVPLDRLVPLASRLRERTGAPLRTLFELTDAELAAITGLGGEALAAARERRATLPLVVDPAWDDRLRAGLSAHPSLRLIRGNRFLHLQGTHDKAAAAGELAHRFRAREGLTVACGDAPNDAGLLARADVAVIIPGPAGPHPELLRRLPRARVAPHPHGRGWAAAVREILSEDPSPPRRKASPEDGNEDPPPGRRETPDG